MDQDQHSRPMMVIDNLTGALHTGMIHLDTEEGTERRASKFPVGSIVFVEKAHYYGSHTVRRCYRDPVEKDDMDYFADFELREPTEQERSSWVR